MIFLFMFGQKPVAYFLEVFWDFGRVFAQGVGRFALLASDDVQKIHSLGMSVAFHTLSADNLTVVAHDAKDPLKRQENPLF